MKRILMTSDAVGGVWTYTLELVRALAAENVEVAVVVMGPAPNPAQRADLSRLKNATLWPAPFALEWMDDPWRDVDDAGDWLLEGARSFAPDVVHLNGYAHAALPWPAPVLVAAHSCVLSWWENVRREPAPPRYDEYRRRVRAGLKAADFVATPTQAFRAELERTYGLRLPGKTIHNARALPRTNPRAKQSCIFSAGRVWDAAKNIPLLARIAPRLHWPVRVAGDCGPDGAAADGVEMLGRLAETAVAREFQRAAIYAAPARYEPFGLSILEAALSGCALVLSDLPTLRELWDGCAIFVPADDEAAWIAALNALSEDAPRRARLQELAAQRVRQFTPARQASACLRAYRQILQPEPALVRA